MNLHVFSWQENKTNETLSPLFKIDVNIKREEKNYSLKINARGISILVGIG